jgi:hypothetical protein
MSSCSPNAIISLSLAGLLQSLDLALPTLTDVSRLALEINALAELNKVMFLDFNEMKLGQVCGRESLWSCPRVRVSSHDVCTILSLLLSGGHSQVHDDQRKVFQHAGLLPECLLSLQDGDGHGEHHLRS